MVDYPKGTLGDAAKAGAGGGFIVGGMLASGGAFGMIPLTMAAFTAGNVIKHGVQSALAANEDAKAMKAHAARKEAYMARREANNATRAASLNPHITKSYKNPK